MHSHVRARAWAILAGGAILVSACGAGSAPAVAPTVATTAAPAPVATVAQATSGPGQLITHKAGEAHKLQPKRLEAVFEIDMGDHFFGNPDGDKNPTFTLPTGKTIGIHIHNVGAELHEIMIGRTLVMKDGEHGYEQNLTELVSSDVFFYYGDVKAEVGGAMYEEIEMDEGLVDVWIRLNVPAELKGEWEIGCFAPDHYEKGMHTKLIFN